MTASRDLAQRLIVDFPQLTPVMDEHLDDQEGELLPYLFMSDVARWAQTNNDTDPQAVGSLVDWLEAAFASGPQDVKDLIGLGFVEALPYPPEGAALLLRLGPELTGVARDLGLLT